MNLYAVGFPARVSALIEGGRLVDLNLAYASQASAKGTPNPYVAANAALPSSLADFIATSDALKAAEDVVAWVTKQNGTPRGPSGEHLIWNLKDADVRPPLPSLGSRIICAAANYPDHLYHSAEVRRKKGTASGPSAEWKSVRDAYKSIADKQFWGFQKWPQNIVGDGEVVHVPKWVRYFDYEVEIVAYIGKKVWNASKEEARKAIFGYSAFNDWSVRDHYHFNDIEKFDEPNVHNLNLCKNVGGATLGPCIVTADPHFDPYNLRMTTKLNDEPRQNGRTGDMVRNFEDMISYLSRFYELKPGDMIAAGTCAGTALEEGDPAKSVHDRDVVECSIEKIGSFKNEVRFDR